MSSAEFIPFLPAGRKTVFDVVQLIRHHQHRKQSLAIIRLGDGEGRLVGFPELVQKNELDYSLRIWFNRTDFAESLLVDLARQLRAAIRVADVVGVPRLKQQENPVYQTLITALRHFQLIDQQMITDSALHRYLQFGLFFRDILQDQPFCGVISCRNLAQNIAQVFNIGKVEQYIIAGESCYPGEGMEEHFPKRFYELREITVPYPSAIFLVGAGALGKIYCQWIKQKGGIAIDVGSVLDAWGMVNSRPFLTLETEIIYNLDVYLRLPHISLQERIKRFNLLCDQFDLDTQRL